MWTKSPGTCREAGQGRQYNTIQYNTIQYNTIQYNTIQYNTIQYNTILYMLCIRAVAGPRGTSDVPSDHPHKPPAARIQAAEAPRLAPVCGGNFGLLDLVTLVINTLEMGHPHSVLGSSLNPWVNTPAAMSRSLDLGFRVWILNFGVWGPHLQGHGRVGARTKAVRNGSSRGCSVDLAVLHGVLGPQRSLCSQPRNQAPAAGVAATPGCVSMSSHHASDDDAHAAKYFPKETG